MNTAGTGCIFHQEVQYHLFILYVNDVNVSYNNSIRLINRSSLKNQCNKAFSHQTNHQPQLNHFIIKSY